MTRDTIIERLRTNRPAVSPPLPDPIPDFPSSEDPIAQFRRELELVGGAVFDGRSFEALKAILTGILQSRDVTSLVWEKGEVLTQNEIPCIIPEGTTPPFVSHHPDHRVEFPLELASGDLIEPETIEVLVSNAACGIAETGTIVESTASGGSRVLPILAPHHVVLLSVRRILQNHAEFFSNLLSGRAESAQILMTGPSRTADIEKILILGVHGPQTLSVILTP